MLDIESLTSHAALIPAIDASMNHQTHRRYRPLRDTTGAKALNDTFALTQFPSSDCLAQAISIAHEGSPIPAYVLLGKFTQYVSDSHPIRIRLQPPPLPP